MLKNLNLNLNMSDNAKYGLGLVLAVVVSVLCGLFVIYPLHTANSAMKTELSKSNVRLATLQTFAGQNQDYQALVKIQNMKIAEAKKKLPDTVSVPDLIAEYSRIADAAGVQLIGVTPSKVTKEGNAYALPITVDLEGDYFKLITFLQQVETGERFVLVQGASYDAEKTGENLKMKANFVVYALKSAKGAPLDAKAAAPKTATGKPAAVDKTVTAK